MNFLENFAIPQSAHHIELLYGLLILTFLLFIPYLALVTGSLILSLFFNRKGKATGDSKYFGLAKKLIDIITFNKSISFALGVVPLLSIIFSYAQLLQGVNSGVPEYLLAALILLLVSIVSLYTYKYSFHLKDILDSSDVKSDDAEKFKSASNTLFNKTGKYSLYLLLLTSWIFFGAISIARESSMWENSFYDVFFSVDSIVKFVGFIFLSLFVTSITVFYTYFRPNTEFKTDESERELLRSTTLKTALVSLLFLPIFLLTDLLTTSGEALSGSVFIFSLFAVLTLIFISIMLYFMIKNNNAEYVNSVLFLSIIFMIFFVVKDQSAFETSSRIQFVKLSSAYEEYKTELLKKSGALVETISGADIYNGRCVACHSFDNKVVGPSYNSVLGKYEGDVDKLSKFILNPVKINPDFPAMPGQGLKPNEAKAVAEYILNQYKGNQ